MCSEYIKLSNRRSTSFLIIRMEFSDFWGPSQTQTGDVVVTWHAHEPLGKTIFISIQFPPCSQNVGHLYLMVWEGGGTSTCTCGSHSSGRFDGHVVPSQTGPQEPQHQAHTSQRLHRLQTISETQPRDSCQ